MPDIHLLAGTPSLVLADLRLVALVVLLAAAAVSDYRSYKLPNRLTVGGMVAGLFLNSVFPPAADAGFWWALQGLLVGLLAMLPLYAIGALGAGDVKLMAMVGAFLGTRATLDCALLALILGGVGALGFALFHRAFKRMVGNVTTVVQNLLFAAVSGIRPDCRAQTFQSVGRLPYGVSISIATIGYVMAVQFGYA